MSKNKKSKKKTITKKKNIKITKNLKAETTATTTTGRLTILYGAERPQYDSGLGL